MPDALGPRMARTRAETLRAVAADLIDTADSREALLLVHSELQADLAATREQVTEEITKREALQLELAQVMRENRRLFEAYNVVMAERDAARDEIAWLREGAGQTELGPNEAPVSPLPWREVRTVAGNPAGTLWLLSTSGQTLTFEVGERVRVSESPFGVPDGVYVVSELRPREDGSTDVWAHRAPVQGHAAPVPPLEPEQGQTPDPDDADAVAPARRQNEATDEWAARCYLHGYRVGHRAGERFAAHAWLMAGPGITEARTVVIAHGEPIGLLTATFEPVRAEVDTAPILPLPAEWTP